MNIGEKFKTGFKTGAYQGMDPKIRPGKAMKSVTRRTKLQQTTTDAKHGVEVFFGKLKKNKYVIRY
ncbi:MAG: hypothetical protein PUE27_10675 [Sharpea porci]|uniref:hypothetical protein n=1 Tax=Sharpea porci TaxID=2652286 RepID=UPI00240A693B|nr:hypothetical protein [Sharpea porci]MDD6712527.1 hypothetical protein [Sharpea porci]